MHIRQPPGILMTNSHFSLVGTKNGPTTCWRDVQDKKTKKTKKGKTKHYSQIQRHKNLLVLELLVLSEDRYGKKWIKGGVMESRQQVEKV